jgi:hypothetical protein
VRERANLDREVMPLRDYLDRFRTLKEELEQHPEAAVYRWHAAPPVSEQTIERVQRGLGFELGEQTLSLYRAFNGLSLGWISKSHPDYDPEIHGEIADGLFDEIPYDVPGGAVNLLPLEALLEDYEDVFYFDWMKSKKTSHAGKKYDLHTFSRSIKPFDYYSEYSMAAFFLGEKGANPPILIGDDHGASFTEHPPLEIGAYLDIVLAVRGTWVGRHDRLHRERPGAPRERSLDELIAWTLELGPQSRTDWSDTTELDDDDDDDDLDDVDE